MMGREGSGREVLEGSPGTGPQSGGAAPLFAFAPGPASGSRAAERDFPLGRHGWSYGDLYRPERLAILDVEFRNELRSADAALSARFEDYRAGAELPPPQDGDLLIAVARHLSRFIATLFGVLEGRQALLDLAAREAVVLRLKDFVARRAIKKHAPAELSADQGPALRAEVETIAAALFPPALTADPEAALGWTVAALLDLDTTVAGSDAAPAAGQAAILGLPELQARLAPTAAAQRPDEDDVGFVRRLLSRFERWAALHHHEPACHHHVSHFVSFRFPHKLDFEALVPLRRPRPELPEQLAGPESERRRRDGFGLTDPRMPPREVFSEVEYCLYCHERRKDSCAHGLREKDGSLKRNPLGIPLGGCPLHERISEMHVCKREGDSLASLCLVTIDNPMVPGTGHRICNDCMKACIFQKQDPVDIPQIETAVLSDVLALPLGFEIYALLTRWNPLNRARPHALPYNGKNVLVVGLGPAGYTLCQYLVNEGFGVVAFDGLKIEPLPADLVGGDAWPPRAVASFDRELRSPLDRRIATGFGGVAEYGITVRWDKSFLSAMYLALARRHTFRAFGGTRFGGTLDIHEAFGLGFHHVAIAAGAGKPTIIDVKNNLIPGVRKASDFLMALQLGGSFKEDSLANLQVRLPALVIGGGLTGIDTTTELAAYYPLQVEKFLARWESLAAGLSDEAAAAQLGRMYTPSEAAVAAEFLEHGRAVRAERARATAAGEAPDFAPLLSSWGGVALVYRKSLQDSPAYRLNHEEVEKFLEEGVTFIENLAPRECLPDGFGALEAVVFEKVVQDGGHWRPSGELVTLPARTLLVAAGTSPNVVYEREHPGSLEVDPRTRAFRSHQCVRGQDGQLALRPTAPGETGFFASYSEGGRFVTFYGDNHPVYAGSVVKAMASAKDGYPYVVALFAEELRQLRAEEQPARDADWARFEAMLEHDLRPVVERVDRLTPTIVEVVVKAPAAARRFRPGQFFRLQGYETLAPLLHPPESPEHLTRLQMEGLALTGASVDAERGLLSLIVLEMGASSRLCARLRPGEPVVLMGPTGTPTEIPAGEAVALCGGGLGNAVLFSIARALRQAGSRVLYFAAYRRKEDIYKIDEIEAATDQIIWSVDSGELPSARRPQDRVFAGNVVEAMLAHAQGRLGDQVVPLRDCRRIIAIGSDRMMAAVTRARHAVLKEHVHPEHVAIASINSPMQCMMKELCAQCLQRQVDPATGKETFVFSCYNQDQLQDLVDWRHLADRLSQNTVQEKLTDLWAQRLLALSVSDADRRHILVT